MYNYQMTEHQKFEFDIDLRDLLDELVQQSLNCISCNTLADKLVALPDATAVDREIAMLDKQNSRRMLDEVRECYLATIGYFNE